MKQTIINIVTRKWNIGNYQSYGKYDDKNEITYNTEILKSNLCDYSDAYILVRGDITFFIYKYDLHVKYK